jgi:hypothetical protein
MCGEAGLQEAAATVRPYAAADRPAVRRIACATAACGDAACVPLPDGELLADLLTSYYTDREPQSAWVAEAAGDVVGYLTGCLDTRRFARDMAWRVVPRLALRGIARGALARPDLLRLVVRNLAVWVRMARARAAVAAGFPAHLHVNLAAGHRGRHTATRLFSVVYARTL